MNIKFKIGDRVVYAYPHNGNEDELIPLGSRGTIVEEDDCPFVKWDETHINHCFIQTELEYEYLYNSPLMKALK